MVPCTAALLELVVLSTCITLFFQALRCDGACQQVLLCHGKLLVLWSVHAILLSLELHHFKVVMLQLHQGDACCEAASSLPDRGRSVSTPSLTPWPVTLTDINTMTLLHIDSMLNALHRSKQQCKLLVSDALMREVRDPPALTASCLA